MEFFHSSKSKSWDPRNIKSKSSMLILKKKTFSAMRCENIIHTIYKYCKWTFHVASIYKSIDHMIDIFFFVHRCYSSIFWIFRIITTLKSCGSQVIDPRNPRNVIWSSVDNFLSHCIKIISSHICSIFQSNSITEKFKQ